MPIEMPIGMDIFLDIRHVLFGNLRWGGGGWMWKYFLSLGAMGRLSVAIAVFVSNCGGIIGLP